MVLENRLIEYSVILVPTIQIVKFIIRFSTSINQLMYYNYAINYSVQTNNCLLWEHTRRSCVSRTVQLISNLMLASTESRVSACFLKHSIKTHVCNHSTRVFNHSTRTFNHSTHVFKFVFDCHGFTSVGLSSNSSGMHCEYITSSDNRYMLIQVHRMHYLSSSNSPVNVRVGNHIRKGRGLILLVIGPAKFNHLSANYTEFYFC